MWPTTFVSTPRESIRQRRFVVKLASLRLSFPTLFKTPKTFNIFQTSASGCHGFGGNQLFRLNTEGQLTSGEWCTDLDHQGDIVVKWCNPGDNSGPWEYRKEEQQVINSVCND